MEEADAGEEQPTDSPKRLSILSLLQDIWNKNGNNDATKDIREFWNTYALFIVSDRTLPIESLLFGLEKAKVIAQLSQSIYITGATHDLANCLAKHFEVSGNYWEREDLERSLMEMKGDNDDAQRLKRFLMQKYYGNQVDSCLQFSNYSDAKAFLDKQRSQLPQLYYDGEDDSSIVSREAIQQVVHQYVNNVISYYLHDGDFNEARNACDTPKNPYLEVLSNEEINFQKLRIEYAENRQLTQVNIEELSNYVNRNPNNVVAVTLLAHCYFAQNNIHEAAGTIKNCLSAHLERLDAYSVFVLHLNLAVISKDIKVFEQAKVSLNNISSQAQKDGESVASFTKRRRVVDSLSVYYNNLIWYYLENNCNIEHIISAMEDEKSGVMLAKLTTEPLHTFVGSQSSVIIHYFLLDHADGNRYLLIAYKIDGHIWKITRSKIDSTLVQAFRTEVEQQSSDWSKADRIRGLLANLSTTLITPIFSDIKDCTNWYISPHKDLWMIPWYALSVDGGASIIDTEYVIHLIPSMSVWNTLKMRYNILKKSTNPQDLLFVAPDFSEINKHIEKPRAVLNIQGEEKSASASGFSIKRMNKKVEVLKIITSYPIIHFVTHGEREQVLLLESDDGKIDYLTTTDLLNLQFDSTKMVVLAACWSGFGESTRDGLTSIGTSFLASGVPTIISALWAAKDKFSVEFFEKFYSHRISAALSFKQAIKLLKETYQNPYIWAVYQLIGYDEITLQETQK